VVINFSADFTLSSILSYSLFAHALSFKNRQKHSIGLRSEQFGGSQMIMTLRSNKLKAANAEALLC
jgi:hypothetical protein